MPLKTVGLKTHIWNNNLKMLLFFLFYPVFITPIWMALSFFILMGSAVYQAFETGEIISAHSFYDALFMALYYYWWIPYIIISVYIILCCYFLRNNLDIKSKHIITRKNNPKIYNILENLCISRGLATPFIFVQKNPEINSYNFGLSHNIYIAISSGALTKLNDEEMEALLAHEVAQILNKDTQLLYLTGMLTMPFAFVLAYSKKTIKDNSFNTDIHVAVAFFSLVMAFLAGIGTFGAKMARFFLSKKIQYTADAGAVELTKNPDALISLLIKSDKIQHIYKKTPLKKPMYFHHKKMPDEFFNSHPKTQDRINKIIEICHLHDIAISNIKII